MDDNYIIKQIPEDFIVIEDSSLELVEKGNYAIVKLWKKNYTTERALQTIANALKIKRKNVGFAGNKDKIAVTEQYISIKRVYKERIEKIVLKDITIKFIGYSKQPVSLGNLKGNNFVIIVRNISKVPICLKKIINYFGEQRFSKNNSKIGKAILKKDFKGAVSLLVEGRGEQELAVEEHIKKSPNDYVGAIKRLPWKVLQIFIHSYQSKLWNEIAKKISEKSLPQSEEPKIIPLIGFGTKFKNEEIKELYEKIMRDEEITQMDFVIRAIPDLTSEGGERTLYCEVKDLKIGEPEDDELNSGKKKIKLEFFLQKGSYATEVVKQMIG